MGSLMTEEIFWSIPLLNFTLNFTRRGWTLVLVVWSR